MAAPRARAVECPAPPQPIDCMLPSYPVNGAEFQGWYPKKDKASQPKAPMEKEDLLKKEDRPEIVIKVPLLDFDSSASGASDPVACKLDQLTLQVERLAQGQEVMKGTLESIRLTCVRGCPPTGSQEAQQPMRFSGSNGSCGSYASDEEAGTDSNVLKPRATGKSTRLSTSSTRSCVDDPEVVQASMLRMLKRSGSADVLTSGRRTTSARVQKHFQVLRQTTQQITDEGNFGIIVDAAMSILVVLQVALIGIRCDFDPDWLGWFVVDVAFALCFLAELALRVRAIGCSEYFCGEHVGGHVFDALVTTLDSLQVAACAVFEPVWFANNVPRVALLRVCRLLRMGRLVRIFRLSLFVDLIRMINGMLGAVSTLSVAAILILVPVYLAAVMMRQTIGQHEEETIAKPYFQSVGRGMYTILRCSFGDCSTDTGTPIFALSHGDYGSGFAAFFCMFQFVMIIGIFNVISAIFVDKIMEASRVHEKYNRHKRLGDKDLFARNVSKLLRCLVDTSPAARRMMEQMGCCSPDDPDNQPTIEDLATLDILPETMEQVVKMPVAQQALQELDISEEDHGRLFDILDADNSGSLMLPEVILGLSRLRGEARRSDTIAIDLMVRSILTKVHKVSKKVDRALAALGAPSRNG
eukprot:TRINITY_DN40043_c0_g1_i1.p1 TRINITY_DN40043_c0_g1~~TRINITY_DN40043_c0_g1_i1.p1  ORF type:complete len:639 (+),score=129.02 TRINITY_DN40043_c0_g1_i1:58-1974(+)